MADVIYVQDQSLIPDDERMQAEGVRIGVIEIQVDDVFDLNNPKESRGFYRAANRLHVETRESTIRPQLLFKSGDPFNRNVLVETARNLRARNYLADATVSVLRFNAESNTVDLLVRVHDNWTLNPGASYSHSGGYSRSGLQLDESNLLGLGKSISLDYSQNVDRDSAEISYYDPNVLSSRWEMRAGYQQASDGGLRSLSLVRPFYSLDARWSASFDITDQQRTDYRFSQGVVVDQYQTRLNNWNVQGGWSTGLYSCDRCSSKWVRRWSLGLTQSQQRFEADPLLGTDVLPADQNSRYPWVGLNWFEDRYAVLRHRDQIDRVEDVFMGRALLVEAGYAAKSLGADRNALMLKIKLQASDQLDAIHSIYWDIGLNGRHQENSWQGTLWGGNVRYDWQQGRDRIFVMKFDYASLLHPDDSQQLYLGSDEGLRGYPLRYRSGTQRGTLIIEQRAYTDWQILRLLSVGGVVFADIGQISGGDYQPGSRKIYADVGIGLRLGNIRSSRGEVFHLDLAYPMNADAKDRKLQFSVSTKNSF